MERSILIFLYFFVLLTWRSGSALIVACTADRSYNLPRSDVHKQRVAREGGVYTGGDGFVWEKRDGTAGKD